MKKLLFISVLSLFCLLVNGQTPAGVPTVQYSGKWYRFTQFLQADSAFIPGHRDTLWTPRFTGTQVYWENGGVDTATWYWTGVQWFKINNGSGNLTGSGVANQIAFWNGTSSLTGATGLTYNGTTDVTINTARLGYHSGRQNLYFGLSALGNNTSSYNTGIGDNSLIDATGNYNTALGYVSGRSPAGSKSVFVGAYSGLTADSSNNTLIGYYSLLYGYGQQNTAVGSNTAMGIVDDTANILNSHITVSSTTIVGTDVAAFITLAGLSVNQYADFSCTFYNTPHSIGGAVVESTIYFKGQVTATNTIRVTGLGTFTGQGTGVFNITLYTVVNNSTAIGYATVATQSNQVAIGNANVTQLKSGNAKFDVSQTPTDNYLWTYDTTAGLSKLKAPYGAPTALTDGATITFNIALNHTLSKDASVTLGGNRTLAMTNLSAGDRGSLIVTQDGTGSRTLTVPAGSKIAFGYGASLVLYLSTAANARDIVYWYYNGTTLFFTGIATDFQ